VIEVSEVTKSYRKGGQVTEVLKGVTLQVRPGEYVMLAVSDTGTGMAPDVIERAFEPFFTTKEPGQGSGLGLSTVYGFAKQSGGHVKIYSEPGHGTTVRLYLPRAQASASAPSPDAAAELPLGRETVLVVEDDADVRALAAALVAGLGYRVIEATDGRAALELLGARADVDLLFTDMVMPGGVDGAELARAARALRPGLKTLFTTGYSEAAVSRQSRLDPGVEVLSKPYRRDELARRLRAVLDREK